MNATFWRTVAVTVLVAYAVCVFFEPAVPPTWWTPHRLDSRLAAAALSAGTVLVLTWWKPARFLVTIVHEVGHALCAALVGGHPTRISMRMDTSGLATWSATGRWRFRRSLVSTSGYLAPPAAGLVGLAASDAGNARPWLFVTAAVFVVTVIGLTRSLVAVTVAAFVGVVTGLVAVRSPELAATATTLLASIWLTGGVRSAYEQFRTTDLTDTDAGTVRRELHLPARLVAGAQLAAATAAGAGGLLIVFR